MARTTRSRHPVGNGTISTLTRQLVSRSCHHLCSFVLGEERITQARFGMRRSIVTLGPSRTMNEFIKTSAFTSNGGNAVVVEERRLVEQGLAHLQVRRTSETEFIPATRVSHSLFTPPEI